MRRLPFTPLCAALATAAVLGLPDCRRGEGPPVVIVPPPMRPNVFNPVPPRAVVKRIRLQFAYNLDDRLVYGHLSWPAPAGRADRFFRFEAGAWVARGGPFREAWRPSDLPRAEAGVALAWNDPLEPAGMGNFTWMGCALACHDSSSFQPGWVREGQDFLVTMHLPGDPFYAAGRLDLWQWRAHRSGPNGYWSDESIDATQPALGDARQADPGSGGSLNFLTGGHPFLVYDPATTQGGRFAVPFAELDDSPDFFFENPADASPIAGLQTPKTLPWDDAVLAGYSPSEGDTVPAFVLTAPTGSFADVLGVLSADGGATVARHSFYDSAAGRWHVYFTRRDLTGDPEDVPFRLGRQLSLAVAVHADQGRGRDHYVSLPYRVWVEDPSDPGSGLGADTVMRQYTGAGVVPDFDDEGLLPPLEVDLFLPGVLSFEFLTDTLAVPFPVGNRHGGAADLAPALDGPVSTGCRVCHVASQDDPDAGLVCGGPLELRTPRRGGLFEATPSSFTHAVLPAFENSCLPCHSPGGLAASVPLHGVDPAAIHQEAIRPPHIDWADPLRSPLLTVPAEDTDGEHGSLAGFETTADYFRILYWILFNAPRN